MNVLRENGKLIFNPNSSPSTGIVFLYASWSESRIYLKYLVGILEGFPQIDLFVYDIDDENVKPFMSEHDLLSHGWGETFWLFEGKIVSKVLQYKTEGTSAIEYTKSLEELMVGNSW